MVSQGMRAEDIANHFYPGNAQSMRADNIPKIIRDATVKAKRTARTEAAAREDAISEKVMNENDELYFIWITEPGACKKCTFLELGGPYVLGDKDSPSIPESSHPNCRCRRVGLFRLTGAKFDNGNIPEDDLLERDNWAKVHYRNLKSMDRRKMVDKISKNSKLDKETVETALAHVFDDVQELLDPMTLEPTMKHFDPDYDMAHSFLRLIDGTDIRPYDILLLKHENLESLYMNRDNMGYREADAKTNETFNYRKLFEETEYGKG